MRIQPSYAMKRNNIIEKLTELLAVYLPHTNFEELHKRHHLIDDLNLDSVAFLQFIMDIEKVFGISINHHELDSHFLTGLDPIADFVQDKLNEIN